MLKDYLVVAQEALSAQKEIYQVKQQRLELAQQEYQQLHAVWEHKLGSQVSCEYLPLPAPATNTPLYCLSVLLESPFSSVSTPHADHHLSLLLLPCRDSFAIYIPFSLIHLPSPQNADQVILSSGLKPFSGWGELVSNGDGVSGWEDEKVVEMDVEGGGDGCTTT